ncbi:MAG: PAS domain S-box protein, partial [Gemmatimonadaceae bacterium]
MGPRWPWRRLEAGVGERTLGTEGTMAGVRKGGSRKGKGGASLGTLDLNAVVEASLDAIIGHDPEGVITHWSGGAQRMFGYPAAEVVGQPIAKIIPPDRIAEGDRLLSRVAAGEPVEPFETSRVTRDGRVIDALITVAPIHDSGGAATGVVEMIRDITAHKAQARALARLTRLYSALSQVNQAIVWTPEREELLQKVCRVLGEHGGFAMIWVGWRDPETEQLVPVAIWGDEGGYVARIRVFADDRPEGQGPSGTAFREDRPVITNDSLNDSSTLPWRDEVLRRGIRSSAAFPIHMQGAVRAVLSVYADERNFFLEREVALLIEAAADLSFALDNIAHDEERSAAAAAAQSERQFSEMMIEGTPGALYFYDARGRFLRWNRELEDVTGYTHAEVAAMHPLELVAPADRPNVEARIAEVFATGQSSVEAGVLRKDGRTVPYVLSGRRVIYNGEPCLVGVGIDISKRREAEDALRESERRFHELASNINEVFWIASVSKQRAVYVSPAYEQIWGRSCSELYASPDSWSDSIHRDDRERVRVAAATKQLAGAYDEAYRIVRPDGAIRWVRDRAFPVHDAAGRVERIVGVVRDIT